VIDEVLAAAQGGLLNGILRLLLRADEQHLPAAGDNVLHELLRLLIELEGLVQVDDVDAVARAVDIAFHLRIPAARLVAEVDSRFEELFHRQRSQSFLPGYVDAASGLRRSGDRETRERWRPDPPAPPHGEASSSWRFCSDGQGEALLTR